MAVLRPTDISELAGAVSTAFDKGRTLEIVAGASKRALGRSVAADQRLELGAFAGIVDYEPSELVLTARAATPMADIEAQLEAEGQMLAFEPPDWRGLLGSSGAPTLGGTVACNLAGPRRVRAGAARDHFLGFSAVNGRGEVWKAGGRVVKNVTGYDMGKLHAGAFGTLSVLTEISVKVLPRPETTCSLVLPGLDDLAAVMALATALNTPHEVSGAAHLPGSAAARSAVPAIATAAAAATVLRLEGPRPSVDFRVAALQALFGGAERLGERESTRLWHEIAGVHDVVGNGTRLVWRVCPTPSAAPALLRAVQARLQSAEGFYDWGGGLVWISLDPGEAGPDGGAGVVRAALAASGHATLVRAPEAVRGAVPVFQPAQAALGALTRRVKASFDPKFILNPGRMQEGL